MLKLKDVIFDRDHTNAIKGVAILLVLLGHIGFIPHAGAYGVVLFLMLSGFGLVQSYSRSGLDNFFSKRLAKVIIPYAVITVIWLISFGHQYIVDADYYKLVMLVLGLDLSAPLDPSMWYIPFLIIWYFAFYLIFSGKISIQTKTFFLFLFSIFMYRNAGLFPMPVGAALYVTAFPIGVAIGAVYNVVKEYSIDRMYLFFGCVILSATSLVAAIYFYGRISLSVFDYSATNIACAFLAIGITSMLRVLRLKLVVFDFFGKISYEMYLLEYMFLMKCLWVLMLLPAEYMKAMFFIITIAIAAKGYQLLLTVVLNKINLINEKFKAQRLMLKL
ncbi:acyltransferase family protein [Citrobacter freundii]|uniref:acyltransferase family protein n=1 Tax=Citrobacter freundii TaxID=546 RepID=UPI0015EA92B0|nr:acyltransferase family protein [Citrobacter freundii]QLY60238.1 acyltransferase family protein [Citrobacter freundii]